MKLLMIFCDIFAYKTSVKVLDDYPDIDENKKIEKALVGFIHVEAEDEKDPSYIETKLIKNLKWAARKNDANTIVVHSFAHLSDSKAGPDVTRQILDGCAERLNNSNYEAVQTPFGYYLDLDLNAPGHSLARLYKEFNCPD